nr:DNA-processing protein DprA [Cellulomonas sp. APG4]
MREARATWSRLVEPGDGVAGALVAALGPVEALAWLRESRGALDLPGALGAPLAPGAAGRLGVCARRWSQRLEGLDVRRDLDRLERLGGHLVVPEDDAWPEGFASLGPQAPLCLWVRGRADLARALDASVAVIGARACTGYGEHVAAEMAGGLGDRGYTVVSGGAYGIDAAAHRGATATGACTVAFLAGGVDRAYPAGNVRLFTALVEAGGALVAEAPPGGIPSRSRFLQRNRLIAAAAHATVVVEAAWRSGALNTAATAARLFRPVGAVPGPVTSAASAGCHRLLREGLAVCVTGADEVHELAGAAGSLALEPAVTPRATDGLDEVQRRTLDALPVRRAARVVALARTAGLTPEEVEAGLGVLELRGLARRDDGGWLRDGRRGTGGGGPVASR